MRNQRTGSSSFRQILGMTRRSFFARGATTMILLLCLGQLRSVGAEIRVWVNGSEMSGSHQGISHEHWGLRNRFNITAPLVRLHANSWTCKDGCASYTGQRSAVLGKIVIGSDDEWNCQIVHRCGVQKFAREIGRAGGLGIIYFKKSLAEIDLWTQGSFSRTKYPTDIHGDPALSNFVFVDASSPGPLLDNYEDIPALPGACENRDCDALYYINIVGGDTNSWKTIWDDGPWWCVQIFGGCVAATLTLFAGWRLWRFSVEQHGLKFTIPQIALLMEIFANAIRFAAYIDYMYTRYIYTYSVGSLLTTADLPFSFLSTILVGVFFSNMLETHGVPQPFKMSKRNSYVLGFATMMLIGIEACLNIGRSFFGLTAWSVIFTHALIMSTLNLIIAGAFYYLGSKFIRLSARSHAINVSAERQMRHIRTSGLYMIVATLGIAVFGVVFMLPWGRVVSTIIVQIGLLGTSFCQISAFVPVSEPYPTFLKAAMDALCVRYSSMGAQLGVTRKMSSKVTPDDVRDTSAIVDRGISVACLRYFVSTYNVDVTLTTEEVVRSLIKKLTSADDNYGCVCMFKRLCSVSTKQNEIPMTGRANHFVCHPWSGIFGDLIESLASVQSASTSKTLYFWIDAFAINQHRPNDWDQLPQMRSVIKSVDSLLMTLAPWDRPLCFTRAWCLYELLIAIQTKTPIVAILPPAESKRFYSSMNTEKIDETLSSIDSINATCSFESDLWFIRSKIERFLGPRGHVERICRDLGLEVKERRVCEDKVRRPLGGEKCRMDRTLVRHLISGNEESFAVGDAVLAPFFVSGQEDVKDLASNPFLYPAKVIACMDAKGESMDKIEVMFSKTRSWLEMQSPKYFLRCSEEGIIGEKHCERQVLWNHKTRTVTDCSTGSVLCRLDDGYDALDGTLKKNLREALVTVVRSRSFV